MSMAPFNFGLASTRDTVLYTSERPGHESIEEDTVADQEEVDRWFAFMKEQKVTCVIALLDENEYEAVYDNPGLPTMYGNAGFKWLIQPMGDTKATTVIFKCIREEEEAGGKVVVHCTGGTGRASRVAAGWLVHR
jgi:protein-tyrosine phosphatase